MPTWESGFLHAQQLARERAHARQRDNEAALAKVRTLLHEASVAIDSTTGVQHDVLVHHRPVHDHPSDWAVSCRGCDNDAGDTIWPCSTWDIAAPSGTI